MKVTMGPPPPKNPNPNPNFDPNPNPNPNPEPEPEPPSADQSVSEAVQIVAPDTASATPAPEPDNEAPQEPDPAPRPTPSAPATAGTTVPYTIPPWSESSGYPFSLEVLKDGAIIEQFDVSEKGAYMFGRVELCDFMLEHPTISRFHAVLQFRKDGKAFIYDLGSTHGTTINKKQVKKKVYVELHVGDVIRFGHSSRLYIFQGPSELMPPEGDLNKIRSARTYEEIHDREASLLRARVEASAADGISWGMDEDAPEEAAENDEDEITWQTYKGQLTERQEKTRGKVIKRMEKVANMKKEIDAIRVKDIAQGGLTQGQQTQIARNEQRISQIMEELDSLEETLNDSIRESLGARVRKVVRGRTKGNVEDEDEIFSDDDEFYDRTQKKPSTKKSTEQQSIETADTLLDKREAIINEMEDMKALLMKEREKLVPSNDSGTQGADDLDAYMRGLSSQLVLDKTIQIEKDMGNLQTDLDKVMYLLKIADPMGEAAQKRNSQGPTSKANAPVSNIAKPPQTKQNSVSRPERPVLSSVTEVASSSTEAENPSEEGKDIQENKKKEVQDIQVKKKKTSPYTATKPQWLGYRDDTKPEENHIQEAHSDEEESDEFVDYKDRKKALISVAQEEKIELAAPGLIIRKRKPVEKPGVTVDKAPKVETSSSADGEATAADAVALLLKHDRGYYALEEERKENLLSPSLDQPEKDKPKSKLGKDRPNSKRVLGPLRPDFLDKTPDCETWAPPEGQTGDGRTSLNDRLGY